MVAEAIGTVNPLVEDDGGGVRIGQSRKPANYSRMPTIAPNRQVASVPETMDFTPSETTSSRRAGAMVARPPIMIPKLPKFAKPHIA